MSSTQYNSLNLVSLDPRDKIANFPVRLGCVLCVGKRGPKPSYRNLLSLAYHFRMEHRGERADYEAIFFENVGIIYGLIKTGALL